jgi:uncharacterized protein
MKVNGSATVAAPMPRVWDALRDPAVLGRVIPGCERFEEVGPDTYAMTVRAGVASIKGTYAGTVTLSDPEPPHAFTLRARGQGAPGTVDATIRVRLSANGGGTRVDYDADAVVGGMIGGVGQRMLAGVTRKTAGEFFAAVENDLVRPVAVAEITPQPVPAAVSGSDAWATAPAFAAGGFVALAGVALGWALARRARRR